MDDLHNQIRNEVRDYAVDTDLSFFDLRQQVGLLRDVIIRNSASGEWMVIFQFHYDRRSSEKRWRAKTARRRLHYCSTLPTSSRRSPR